MHMVHQDTVFHSFWHNKRHFADLCNALIYEGKQVVHPASLQDMDSNVSTVLPQGEHRRYRDLIKKVAGSVGYLVVGIENQSSIDAQMPLRVMGYDYLSYLRQWEEKEEAEKLDAVITIVIYYGERKWNKARKLSNMMKEVPKEAEKRIQDYEINLLELRESEGMHFEDEEVRSVMELCRYILRGDKKRLREEYGGRSVRQEIAQTVGEFLQEKRLLKEIEGKEEIDMCQMIDHWIEDGKQEGIAIGEERGEQKGILLGKQEGEKAGLLKGLYQTAINMLKEGFPVEMIHKITGLSETDIKNLKSS